MSADDPTCKSSKRSQSKAALGWSQGSKPGTIPPYQHFLDFIEPWPALEELRLLPNHSIVELDAHLSTLLVAFAIPSED